MFHPVIDPPRRKITDLSETNNDWDLLQVPGIVHASSTVMVSHSNMAFVDIFSANHSFCIRVTMSAVENLIGWSI